MQVTSGVASCVMAGWLLGRCGIRPAWQQVAGYFLFASIVSTAAFAVATLAVSGQSDPWGRIVVGATVYGVLLLLCYFRARARLRGIAFGALN